MTVMDQIKDLREKASMDYWWPRLAEVDVPTPQTVGVGMQEEQIEDSSDAEGGFTIKRPVTEDVIDAIETVGGPPAFLRTDQASAKHRMEKASKVDSLGEETVGVHVWNVIEHNEMAGFVGLPYKTFYIREWLDLAAEFTAFTGTPIAPELRFFLLGGEVMQNGFYWTEDAIRRPDADDWRERHVELRRTAFSDELNDAARFFAKRVADEFDTGYWSVDFALTTHDKWYCIDMAPGELSWHPESCEQLVPDPRERDSRDVDTETD